MSYDALANIRRLREQEDAARVSDAARLANDIQHSCPGASRSEALAEAERIQAKYGMGLVISGMRVVVAHARTTRT